MPFRVAPPEGTHWADVTEHLDDPSSPLTFAKADGVGALQFSAATYKQGEEPGITVPTLMQLLQEFAEANGLGAGGEGQSEPGAPLLAAASFRTDAFFRVWYVSDGKSVALATYTCALENESQREDRECEAIVRSVRFT